MIVMAYGTDKEGLGRQIDGLRSSEGYLFAGSPKFLGLFGRDSLISAWQLLDYDPSIAACSMRALVEVQGKKEDYSTGEQPGKIAHEYYKSGVTSVEWFNKYKMGGTWPRMDRPEYLSVDSTPLFMMVLSEYYAKTNDHDTLEALWPNAKAALGWVMDYGVYEGFVRYVPNSNKLLAQGWKDGADKLFGGMKAPVALVEVQGYAYSAMTEMLKLMDVMNDEEMRDRTDAAAASLKGMFEDFWIDGSQYCATAIDGGGEALRTVTSNPGHLLLTGILDKERLGCIARRLLMIDMLTPYGIRTQSSDDAMFDPFAYQLGSIWPHDNWMIAKGLQRVGFDEGYRTVRDAVIKAADELGSIPEYYGVSKDGRLIGVDKMRHRACDPQAWSLGALMYFVTH